MQQLYSQLHILGCVHCRQFASGTTSICTMIHDLPLLPWTCLVRHAKGCKGEERQVKSCCASGTSPVVYDTSLPNLRDGILSIRNPNRSENAFNYLIKNYITK